MVTVVVVFVTARCQTPTWLWSRMVTGRPILVLTHGPAPKGVLTVVVYVVEDWYGCEPGHGMAHARVGATSEQMAGNKTNWARFDFFIFPISPDVGSKSDYRVELIKVELIADSQEPVFEWRDHSMIFSSCETARKIFKDGSAALSDIERQSLAALVPDSRLPHH
jgi:hypothetical protein